MWNAQQTVTSFLATIDSFYSTTTTQSRFVLVASPEVQLSYPILGLIPYPATLSIQALILSALVAPVILYIAVTQDQHHGTTARQVVEIGVYLYYRLVFWLKGFASLLCSEVMTIALAPIGVASDLASRLHSLTGLSHSQRSHAFSSGLDRPERRRRRLSSALGEARKIPYQFSPVPEMQPSGSTVTSEASGSHHPGLYNTGNTCFFNSVVQGLASVPALAAYLDQITRMAEEWDVPTPVTDALKTLLRELNTQHNQRSALQPRELADALATVSQANGLRSLTGAHEQQDAHELFVLLSSAIDDELVEIQKQRTSALRAVSGGLRAATAPSEPLYPFELQDPSNPFRGLSAQRTSCVTCGYVEAVRHFAIDELSLTVPRASSCRLEDLLQWWTELEEVDWICHRCSLQATLQRVQGEIERLGGGGAGVAGKKEMTTARKKRLREARRTEARLSEAIENGEHEDEVAAAKSLKGVRIERVLSRCSTKQVMLARPPQILALHLNRSTFSSGSYGATKNNARVLFTEYLDVAPFTTTGELATRADRPISQVPTGSLSYGEAYRMLHSSTAAQLQHSAAPRSLYRLDSIVVHYGGHSFGHYVSFRRRPERLKGHDADVVDLDIFGRPRDAADWLRISDDSVGLCDVEDVLGQNPFLLFYERVPTDTTGVSADGDFSIPRGFSNLIRQDTDGNLKLGCPPTPRVAHRWSSR